MLNDYLDQVNQLLLPYALAPVDLAVPAVVVYGPHELFTSMSSPSSHLKLERMNFFAASSLRTSFMRTTCHIVTVKDRQLCTHNCERKIYNKK